MLKSMQEVLEYGFAVLNRVYFNNELPPIVITIMSSPKTNGHFTVGKVWKAEEGHYNEINISAEHLDRPIENIMATLCHEMVHYYCQLNGIQGTSTSTDYKIMNCLRNFNALFTEDMLKTAYERAKHYYEISTIAVKQRKDRSVIDIYAELVTSIKSKARSEVEAGIAEDDRKYFSEGNVVEVESKELDKVLEDIEAGCSKTVFAKNLERFGEIMNRLLIITNKGRWGFNKTGNKRVYKFIVDEDLIKMYEAKEVA